ADVIDLRGRLVQPTGPGLAAVQGDQGALVDTEDLPVRVGRVDPHLVEIVAGGVALQRDEVLAAIVRAQHDGIHHVDAVGVLRIHRESAEIPAALPDALIRGDMVPVRAAVVGAVQAAFAGSGIDQCIHAARLARCYRDADAPGLRGKAVALHLAPVSATIMRYIQAAARPVRWRVHAPRRPTGLP